MAAKERTGPARMGLAWTAKEWIGRYGVDGMVRKALDRQAWKVAQWIAVHSTGKARRVWMGKVWSGSRGRLGEARYGSARTGVDCRAMDCKGRCGTDRKVTGGWHWSGMAGWGWESMGQARPGTHRIGSGGTQWQADDRGGRNGRWGCERLGTDRSVTQRSGRAVRERSVLESKAADGQVWVVKVRTAANRREAAVGEWTVGLGTGRARKEEDWQ